MALLLTFGLLAQAQTYEYPYLAVQTTDGSTVTLSVDEMELTIVDGQQVMVNGQGENKFDLASLVKMYFTTETQGSTVGISSVTESTDGVDVYSVSGVYMGRFNTLAEAQEQLRQGIYVMKSKEKTFKMTVK